jgi:hypothetical protein
MSLESPEHNDLKEQQWRETLRSLDRIVDKLVMPIDAGIKETITALKCSGFETSGSCEGHVERGIKAPWVDVSFFSEERKQLLREQVQQSEREEAKKELQRAARMEMLAGVERLTHFLDDFYEGKETSFNDRLVLRFFPDSVRLYSQGAELQDLYPPDERSEKLEVFQKEMAGFTDFLKHNFFS